MEEENGGVSSSEVEAGVQDFLKALVQELCGAVALGNVKETGFTSEASNVVTSSSAAAMDGEKSGEKKEDEEEEKMAVLYIVCVLLFFSASLVVLLVRHVRRERETRSLENFYRDYLLTAHAAASPVVYFDKQGRLLPKIGISSSYSQTRRGSLRTDSTSNSQSPAPSTSFHATASSNSQSPVPSTSHHPTTTSSSKGSSLNPSQHASTTSSSRNPALTSILHATTSTSSRIFAKDPSLHTTTSGSSQSSIYSSRPSVTPAAMYWSSESSGSDIDEDVDAEVRGSRVTHTPFRTPKTPRTPTYTYDVTCLPNTSARLNEAVNGGSDDSSGLSVPRIPFSTLKIPHPPFNRTVLDVTCLPDTPVQLHNIALSTKPHTPGSCTVLVTSPDTPVQLHNTTVPTTSSQVTETRHDDVHNATEALTNSGTKDFVKMPSATGQLTDVKYDGDPNATEAFTNQGTKDLFTVVGKTECTPAVLDGTCTPTFPRPENSTLLQTASGEGTEAQESIHPTTATPGTASASNTRPSDTTIINAATQYNTNPGALPKRLSGRPTSL